LLLFVLLILSNLAFILLGETTSLMFSFLLTVVIFILFILFVLIFEEESMFGLSLTFKFSFFISLFGRILFFGLDSALCNIPI
jgi:hypothetical protein